MASHVSAQAPAGTQVPAPQSVAGVPGQRVSPEEIQQAVDQAIGFNLFAVPEQVSPSAGGGKKIYEVAAVERLHRFQVGLEQPTSRVQASNILGEQVGRLDLQWSVIPDDFLARPDHRLVAVPLDPNVSQRFAIQQMTFKFGDGTDAFRTFGTGRTFPMTVGDQPRLVVAAVANVTEAFGKFQNCEGNLTICGDLTPRGFRGNILTRFQDPIGKLRSKESLPPIQPQADPDPQTTYLLWAGQKGEEPPGLENHFSMSRDGQVRGMDITTQLKLLHLDFAQGGAFQGQNFMIGKKLIGLEIGFGRGSLPNASPVGTPLSPYLFEGVARYSILDNKGNTLGALLTNVIEGRRFDMPVPAAPGGNGWRFGFFGPIVYGTGCFEGVRGMFYGASGSVFYSLPDGQVVTHFYMARIDDPQGKFRSLAGGRGWN
jgi:hypothetical protein